MKILPLNNEGKENISHIRKDKNIIDTIKRYYLIWYGLMDRSEFRKSYQTVQQSHILWYLLIKN